MGDDWKSTQMRQRVVQQLEEVLRLVPPQAKTAAELEETVSYTNKLFFISNF